MPGEARQPAVERGGADVGAAVERGVRAAPILVVAEQRARGRRQRVGRGALGGHHVRVEGRRAADGLAGVVDDEVEPLARRHQLVAERLDARRVPEVEPEDLEPVAPLGEVRLARVARGGVAGKAGGDDEACPAPQQLEPRLVADLDPPAGQQRHRPAQVGELGALGEVELGARRAELVVEVMQRGEVRLADVAVLLLERLPRRVGRLHVLRDERLGRDRREDVGRGEDRLAAEGADAGAVAEGLLALDALGLPAAGGGADELAAAHRVGGVDVAGRLEEARAVLGGDAGEEGAVGDDSLEHVDGGAELGEEGCVGCRGEHARI